MPERMMVGFLPGHKKTRLLLHCCTSFCSLFQEHTQFLWLIVMDAYVDRNPSTASCAVLLMKRHQCFIGQTKKRRSQKTKFFLLLLKHGYMLELIDRLVVCARCPARFSDDEIAW